MDIDLNSLHFGGSGCSMGGGSEIIMEPGPASFLWLAEDDGAFTLTSSSSSSSSAAAAATILSTSSAFQLDGGLDISMDSSENNFANGDDDDDDDVDMDTAAEIDQELDRIGARAKAQVKLEEQRATSVNGWSNGNSKHHRYEEDGEEDPFSTTLSAASAAIACGACHCHLRDANHAITHMLTQHSTSGSGGSVVCTLCQARLSHGHSLRKHVKSVHFRMEEYECPHCHKAIQQRSHLNRHIEVVHKQKPPPMSPSLSEEFQCQTCRRRFFGRERRDRHVREEHGLKCGDCGKVCYSQTHLASHRLQHSKENRGVALDRDCKVCGRVFISPEAKRSHMRTVHQNMRPFNCGLCSHKMWSSLHLKAHLRLHTNEKSIGKRKDDIRCDICRENFQSNDKLLSHVEEFHAYQCPECSKHFQTTSGLAKHYKKAHFIGLGAISSEKKLPSKTSSPCTLATIPTQVTLNAMTGKCGFCSSEQTFSKQQEFDLHVQEIHPYRCPVCPSKMLKYPSSIRKHFRTHHGHARPHFCRRCTVVFQSEKDRERNHKLCLENRTSREEGGGGGEKEERMTTPVGRGGGPMMSGFPGGVEAWRNLEIVTPDPDEIVEEIIVDNLPDDFDRVFVDQREKQQQQQQRGSVELDGEDCEDEEVEVEMKSSAESVSGALRCRLCVKDNDDLDDEFESEQALLDHVAEEHPFTCPHCRRPYKFVDSLKKHCRSSHNGLVVTVCRLCAIVFTEPEDRDSHMDRVHSSVVVESRNGSSGKASPMPSNHAGFSCFDCDRVYAVADSLRKHSKSVHGISVYTCGPCVLTFRDSESRRLHGLTHGGVGGGTPNGNGNSTLNSINGDDSAAEMEDYNEEEEEEGEEEPGESDSMTYQCKYCEKSYEIGDSLRKHAKSVHGKCASVCKFCPSVFNSVDERDQHVERRHQIGVVVGKSNNVQQQSLLIGKQLASPPKTSPLPPPTVIITTTTTSPSQDLNQSSAEGGPSTTMFSCPDCPKLYKLVKSLRRHYREQHHPNRSLKICQKCCGGYLEENESVHVCVEDPIKSRSGSPDFGGFRTPTPREMEVYLEAMARLKSEIDEEGL